MKINKKFCKGILVFYFPWVIVFLLRDIGPITYGDLYFDTKLYLTIFFTLFFISYFCGFFLPINKLITKGPSINETKSTYNVLFTLSIIFLVIANIDFFFIKNGGLNISELRRDLIADGPRSSYIGAIQVILSGFPVIFFCICQERQIHLKKTQLTKSKVIYMLYLLSCFYSGGRNTFVISFVFVFIYYMLFVKRNVFLQNEFNMRNKLSLINIIYYIFLIMAIGIVFYLFLDRKMTYDPNLEDPLFFSFSHQDTYIKPIPTNASIFITYLYIIYVHFIFYLTHCVSFLNDYFSGVITLVPSFGALSFPLLGKVSDLLFNTELFINAHSNLIQDGVYLTLIGNLYIDFGYIGGLIFFSLCAFIYGVLTRNIANLKYTSKLLLIILSLFFLFSPIYNVFGIGNGTSLIIAYFFIIFQEKFKLSLRRLNK